MCMELFIVKKNTFQSGKKMTWFSEISLVHFGALQIFLFFCCFHSIPNDPFQETIV